MSVCSSQDLAPQVTVTSERFPVSSSFKSLMLLSAWLLASAMMGDGRSLRSSRSLLRWSASLSSVKVGDGGSGEADRGFVNPFDGGGETRFMLRWRDRVASART